MFDDTKPIFLQLAERVADDILRGRYDAGDQVPSTNELAAHLRINPATAGKALGLLVDQGVLEKRRGIGMFVTEGARARIAAERQGDFADTFIRPLITEAHALGLSTDDVVHLITALSTVSDNTREDIGETSS